MPTRFDFISPGVSIRELDESQTSDLVTDDGILLIGTAPQGPGNKPIKINNLEDFYTIFGKPISGKGSNSTDVWRDGNQQGTTYAMYAAQAWLASQTSPVTFIRLLGEDQVAASQATGYVEAGWSTYQANGVPAADNASAYGIFVMPSGAATSMLTGTLAAVIYSTGSSWAVSGNIEGRSSRTTASLGTFIQSTTTAGRKNTFTLVQSSSTGEKKYVVHFDRKQKDGYIRNVLNCNPQKTKAINYASTESYFLGETFDEATDRVVTDAGSSSAGQQYAIMFPLSDATSHYSDRKRAATAAMTGWFINRDPNPGDDYASYSPESASKLFRLVSLHEGEWFGMNYGVRMENLRLGTTANPTSTFSVVIVNSDGEEVERFDNLNLTEGSSDFVGKRIGDQFQTYNTTLKKYQLFGEYPNQSDYIRVEMAGDWKAGISDKRALPWGVWGPLKPNDLLFGSGSANAGSNTLVPIAHQTAWHFGHTGSSAALIDVAVDISASLRFPDIKLTDSGSNNNGNYTKDYVFGVRHMLDSDNRAKKTLYYSPCYKDLVRALPADLDITGDTASSKLKISWIFTLDDIRVDSTDSSRFYYESGSHASGDSYTKANGSNGLLTAGVKKFNAAFVGGHDGLDIRQVDPFSIATSLASTENENSNYAYYSVQRTIDLVSDKDLIDYDLISMPGLQNEALANELIRMAEERSDALAIVDLDSSYRKPYENSGTETLGTSTAAISNAISRDYDTSYAATYYPPVRLRDTAGGAGDVTVVPASVAAIGAIGRSEAASLGPWFAPAGFNRGGIGVLGGSAGPRIVGTLEHLTKQDRDDLYEENINPIARFPSIGEIVIFGQKTLQQTPSALDRINVRRLMIYLKKRIGRIADTILFDQNVNTTWFRFRSRADIVLRDVRDRFGITEYKLILDETTTTADLVDRNIMYAKIFVKPARAIEFIAIDFVITRSGVEF